MQCKECIGLRNFHRRDKSVRWSGATKVSFRGNAPSNKISNSLRDSGIQGRLCKSSRGI